jgi:hypothetical protein
VIVTYFKEPAFLISEYLAVLPVPEDGPEVHMLLAESDDDLVVKWIETSVNH